MYTQRIIHFPAVGKGPDLRAALEERNNDANAAAPHSLSSRMFSLEPAFVHSIRFDNLAAIETYQGRNPGPAFQATGVKINQCLSRERATELHETLVPAQVAGTPKYSLRITHFPAPGKGPELRGLLEERVSKTVRGRLGAGLSTQVAPPDGPAFVVTQLFSGMAGMDEARAANQEDPSFQAWAKKVAALAARPPQQEMLRILAPFPAR